MIYVHDDRTIINLHNVVRIDKNWSNLVFVTTNGGEFDLVFPTEERNFSRK